MKPEESSHLSTDKRTDETFIPDAGFGGRCSVGESILNQFQTTAAYSISCTFAVLFIEDWKIEGWSKKQKKGGDRKVDSRRPGVYTGDKRGEFKNTCLRIPSRHLQGVRFTYITKEPMQVI